MVKEQCPSPRPGIDLLSSFGKIAFTKVAEKLVFNAGAIEAQETEYLRELDRMGIRKELLENSM